MINIAKPIIGDEEIEAVTEVLKSGMLAQGPKVEEFQKAYREQICSSYKFRYNSTTCSPKGR